MKLPRYMFNLSLWPGPPTISACGYFYTKRAHRRWTYIYQRDFLIIGAEERGHVADFLLRWQNSHAHDFRAVRANAKRRPFQGHSHADTWRRFMA